MNGRAVLLAHPGDPFLFTYFIDLYRKVWKEEVDQLYVHFNSPIDKRVFEYEQRIAPDVKFLYSPTVKQHGDVLNELLDIVEEENIMLIEDDGYIFRSGVVHGCFTLLEQGNTDIVAGARGSCSSEINEHGFKKWGTPIDGEGDQGVNFFPNFFFCKKELLLKTDRNFNARLWKKGERIPQLDMFNHEFIAPADLAGDTFVSTSLQLRDMVPVERILLLPQYHTHPFDYEHYVKQYQYSPFNGKASWLHVGSLSSGILGLIRDSHDRPLAYAESMEKKSETILPVQLCQTDMERREFERRVQAWHRALEVTLQVGYPHLNSIADISIAYMNGLDRIIDQFKLNRKNILKMKRIYNEVFGL